ncbi:MAG: trigger factor [Actinomycetota bacterium]
MKSTLEEKGPTQVQLNVEVPPEELKQHRAETLRRLSNEVKIPGFRKGKVPATVLESRMGREQVRQEILSDALPALYSQALAELKIQPLSQPDIDVTVYSDNEALRFTATVDVRPNLKLPEYEGIEVPAPRRTASEADIGNRLERMRERFGTLEPVKRPAGRGDFATIDLFGFRHGQPIEGASLQDFVYEVGSARFIPKMDEELVGTKTGDIVEFNAVLPRGFVEAGEEQQEATLKVVVKEVQARKLPALDDEFAKTSSEFQTLEELKADIDRSISGHRAKDAEISIRNYIMQDLIARTDVPLPKALVDRETELRLARTIRDLGGSGSNVDEYLKANSMTRESLIEQHRNSAEISVAADLVLEQVAKEQDMTVSKEDLMEEIEIMAEQMKTSPTELADSIANSGSLSALAGDILRRKALDFLVRSAKVTDEAEAEPEPAESPND